MATKPELDRMATKAMEDDTFRTALEADPAKAAAILGIKLTSEQVTKLKTAVIETVEGRKSKVAFGAYI